METFQAKNFSDRVLFFTDAVFAIAITLLALEIKLPENIDLGSEVTVWRALGSLGPHFFAFTLSFLIIGTIWAGHLRKYSGGVEVDRTFVSLNLFLLLAVAFMPFSTNLFSVSDTRVATIFYGLNMVAVGLLSAWGWWYAAIRHNYLRARPTDATVRAELISSLLVCAVFGVSVVVALYSSSLARWSWLLFLPAIAWLRRKARS